MPTTPPQPPGSSQPGPASPPGGGQRTRQPCPRVAGRPLPDPAAVRLCAVPDFAPPYDDEALPATVASATQPPGGATGPAARDGARPAEPHRTRAAEPGAAGPAEPDGARRDGDGRAGGDGDRRAGGDGSTPAGGDGPAGPPRPAWPGQFAQVLVETLAGSRPPRQMRTWTTERARARIQRLGPVLAAGQRPHLRRVVAFRPASDVIEMTVVVSFGPRTRALAVRLEHTAARRAYPGHPARAGRWLCTDVEAA